MAQGADFRSRITLDGADQVAGDLKKIGTTGDQAFNAVGKAADGASASVGAFSRASDLANRSMAALQSQSQAMGQGFRNLHQHATNFGNSLGNVANNIIPRFSEILALGTVGGVAGFFKLFEATAQWGHELEQNAKTLGLTPNQFNTIAQAAKRAGIDVDTLTMAMTRFSVSVEKAGEERKKAFGEIAKDVLGAATAINAAGVQILRGGRSGPAVPDTSRFLQVPKLDQFQDQAEEIYNVLRKAGAIQPNVGFSRWLSGITTTLTNGGEAADKLRQELNKVGANLPSRTVGEQIERSLPGFRDLFAQLRVPLFDKATGDARAFLDVFGDFLDKFKDLSEPEQARIVMEKFGRGARSLIPIMQGGSNSLGEFVKEAKALGIETTAFDKEISALSEAERSLRRMDAAIMGVRKSLVVPFADVFTPLFKEWASVLDANKGQVKAWATDVATQARTVALDLINVFRGIEPQTEFGRAMRLGLDALTIAVGVLKGAFNSLVAVIQTVVDPLNALFGTNYSAQTYALAAAFLYFSGILPAVATGIRLVWAALQLIYATPFGIALAAIAAAGLLIYNNWDTLGPLFQKLWDLLKSFGSWLSEQWVKFWTDPIQGIKDQWNAIFDWFGQKLTQLKNLIRDAVSSLPGSMAGGDAPPMPAGQMAAGGIVPGSGGGDTFPALLTPGEFVMRRSVVDALGAPFFAALNRGSSFVPRGRYATGGLVASTSAGNTVNLHLDGQSFGLRADNDTFDSLLKTARSKALLSAGRKPSWAAGRRYGG